MNKIILRVAIFGTGIFLAGCAAVGPDFERPEIEVKSEWLEASDPEVDVSRIADQNWWQVFNDPVLNELIDTAYDDNLNLQVAGLRILEARAQLGYADGMRYPQSQSVQTSASRSRVSENAPPFSSLPPAVGDNIDSSIGFWSTSFNVAWEADIWGRFRRGIESADANLAATMLNYDAVLVTLTGDVALVYTQIRTLEQQLLYTRSNVKVQETALDIAEARFEFGAASELDVVQAESQVNATKAIIPLLEIYIRQARNALSLLLGMEPGEVDRILGGPGALPVAPKQAAVGIPAELIRRRPDVRAAEMAAAAQSGAIGVAAADLYPSFALAGSFGIAGETFSEQFESGSGDGFISPVVNWKIFNYGRLRNNVRVQDARFEQMVVRYENVILNALREVEDGLIGFLRAQDEVGYFVKAVAASERSVELSLDQYESGMIDYQRVLQSQGSLLIQQDALAKARGRVVGSLVSTYRSLGGGWQLREGQTYVSEGTLEKMRDRTNWGEMLDDQTEPAHLDPGAQ